MGIALAAAILPACGAIEYQSTLIKPAAAGRPYVAGIGDTVVDVKLTQSLPNAYRKADIFGGTRDTGRVIVRLIALDGGQAVFQRDDVVIQSNETTMTQGPQAVLAYQTSSMNGAIGSVPVSGSRNTFGLTYVPPTPSYSYPIQSAQVQVTAPIGGSMLVEGRRVRILRGIEGGVEYSVD
jgi:hypothetical protein